MRGGLRFYFCVHWISGYDFIGRLGSKVKAHLKISASLKFPVQIHLPSDIAPYEVLALHIDFPLGLQHCPPRCDVLA